MGEVYEVHDEHLDETVALKTVRADVETGEDGVDAWERFENEIRIARRVTHRNVCRVFDAGRHRTPQGETVLYLTMERLRGETLDTRIRRQGSFEVDAALPIVRQLAEALDAAHREGIVHRDFKSGNILIEPDERVVVTDFGLAAAVGAERRPLRSSSGPSGTVAFMAPEQVEGAGPGPESDIYSLGVVIYQMLSGDVPFRSSTPLGTAVRRLREDAPPLREKVPEVPRLWNDAVARCLARDPSARWASGRELVEALERRRSLRLRRALLSGVVGVVVGGLGIATWLGRSVDESSGPRLAAAGEPRQSTSDLGLEIDPAFDPAGGRLAFATDRSGSFEVVVRSEVAGAEDLALTSDGQQNVQPAWSPDGSSVAFVSLGRGGIFRVPSGGGAARRLTEFGSRPAWSPDGRWIAFQEDVRHEVAERSLPAFPPSTLWRLSADGGEPMPLTRTGEPEGGHGEPAWSPDGRWIYFSSGTRRRTAIWAVDVEGPRGDPVPVVEDSRIAQHPRPTPDGSGLVWVGVAAERAGAASYALWWSALDGENATLVGEPQRLSGLGLATLRTPALSSGGDRVVWSTVATASQIFALDIDSDGAVIGQPVAWTAGNHRNSRPAFSPDGRRIAFDRWQVGTNLDIWELEIGNGSPRAVSTDEGWDSMSVWLDDGRISWLSDREGERGLWLLDPTTRRMERMGPHSRFGSEIEWARSSPDGTRAVFHRITEGAGLDVWVRDLVEGTEMQLTRDPEMAGFPVWAPDSTTLAFEIRRSGSTHVCVVDASGGEIRQLTSEEGEAWPFGFSPDGDRVLYSAQRSSFWSIRWVSRSTGEDRVLFEEPRLTSYVRYPVWSPDGARVVFERSETTGDLWALDLAWTDETGG